MAQKKKPAKVVKKVQKPAAAAKATAKPVKKAASAPAKKAVAAKPVAKEKAKPMPETEALAPVLSTSTVTAVSVTVEEVILTDADGRRYCRVKDCDQAAIVEAYCRYHYLLYWKKIQVRKKILDEGRLERYIEELTSRYPDKFLEMLRKDLRSEKEFVAAIQELEIDESAVEAEFEDDAAPEIEEVRGISDVVSGRDEEEF